VARPGDIEFILPLMHGAGEIELDICVLQLVSPWPGPVMLSISCPPRHRPGKVEQVLPPCHRSGEGEMQLPPWPGPAMLRWNKVVWGCSIPPGRAWCC
jgi:hypothetical protein